MKGHNNFIVSSGCDIPPGTGRENFDVFFNTVSVYNQGRMPGII
jgi:uroporphyrinogen-III decarboxylase